MRNLILILLLFRTICSYSQGVKDTIDKSQVPTIIENEEVYIKGEMWLETVEDEIKQRHKIDVLNKNLGIAKRKLNKINVILKKKRRNELKMDSLIYEISNISKERDSLLTIVEQEIGLNRKKLLSKIYNLESRLDIVYGKYVNATQEKRILRKKLFLSIAGNVILVAVLIVVI